MKPGLLPLSANRLWTFKTAFPSRSVVVHGFISRGSVALAVKLDTKTEFHEIGRVLENATRSAVCPRVYDSPPLVFAVGCWDNVLPKGGLNRHHPSVAGQVNASGESHQELLRQFATLNGLVHAKIILRF